MRRRILVFLFQALFPALSMALFPALGAAPGALAADIDVPRQHVWPGEPIVFNYLGMPGNDQDWLTIVPEGASDMYWGQWFYTGGARAGTHVFEGLEVGDYEIRAYADWPDGDFIVIARGFVQVTCTPLSNDPAENVRLSLTQPVYAPDEEIVLHWSGLPDHDDNWVSVARADAPDDEREEWHWCSGPIGTQAFSPLEPGNYEARLYLDWSGCDYVVQAIAPFQVAGASPFGNNVLAMTNARLSPSDPVSVSYTAEMLSADAWVGLVPSDTPHGSGRVNAEEALQRQTLPDPNGSGGLRFQPVAEPGHYDLRMFDTTDGREVAATSFQVLGVGSLFLDKDLYRVGEEMAVRATVPDPAFPARVLVVTAGAPREDPDEMFYPDKIKELTNTYGAGGFVALEEVPGHVGEYEVRLYQDDEQLDALAFAVTAENSLTLAKARYALGEPVPVAWTAAPFPEREGQGLDSWDALLVLVRLEDNHTVQSLGIYPGGKGERSLDGVWEEGSYEVRLLDNERNVAASAPLTVRSISYIDLFPEQFDPGARMRLAYMTDFLPDDAWLGVLPADASHNTFEAKLNALWTTDAASHQYTHLDLTAPDRPGDYEVRIYSSEEDGRLMASKPFTVREPPPPDESTLPKIDLPLGEPAPEEDAPGKPGLDPLDDNATTSGATPYEPYEPGPPVSGGQGANTITLDRSVFLPGMPLGVSFTADEDLSDYAWIGIVPAKVPPGDEMAADAEDLGFEFVEGRPWGVAQLTVPARVGDYEVRFFASDSGGAQLAGAPFRVGIQGTYIALEPRDYAPGESVEIYWNAPDLVDTAWIGMVPSTTPDDGEVAADALDLAYRYLMGANGGFMEFTAPAAPGQYDLRMFENDAGGRELARATFTVR